jgi:hypothetical protein
MRLPNPAPGGFRQLGGEDVAAMALSGARRERRSRQRFLFRRRARTASVLLSRPAKLAARLACNDQIAALAVWARLGLRTLGERPFVSRHAARLTLSLFRRTMRVKSSHPNSGSGAWRPFQISVRGDCCCDYRDALSATRAARNAPFNRTGPNLARNTYEVEGVRWLMW